MVNLKFNSTANINIPKKLIDQVIGQDEAVEVIKKAAQQRRHVLLIGEPGTGKSMLGIALAELLPMEKLVDLVAFPNPNDENTPFIRTLPAGQGRDLVAKARVQAMTMFKNQNIVMFIIVLISFFAPFWAWNYFSKFGSVTAAIMSASTSIMFILILVTFALSMNLSKRVETKVKVPRVIVDNYRKKQAPFNDATGAHAGALLGDVLHDPFQTFYPTTEIILSTIKNKKIVLQQQADNLFQKYDKNILKIKENNYEALHLPKDELFILSEVNGKIEPVEVLSLNRYNYQGEMIKLATDDKELIVTPEHKIAISQDNKIEFKQAKDITTDDTIVTNGEYIIDEQDIINSYDARQAEQCQLFYQHFDVRSRNPEWGYKRIAKSMNQKIGKTRWWHENKHIPVPLQTARWLKEKGLLPLKIDNPKLPLIGKVIGATFGDGGIFDNLNGIFLSSSEKEAAEEFGKDLEVIFGKDIAKNSRIIEGGVYGHSWCYQNTNRNIIRFFLALGAPKGNKTKIELKVPSWIKINKELEGEFYGSFFGSELGTPIIHKNGNYLTTFEVGITGTAKLGPNRVSFLNEVSDYLGRNRVTTTSIYEGKTSTEDTKIYRLLIEKKLDNIILFLMDIKINYCNYKQERIYKALGQWVKLKLSKYNQLTQKGHGAEHAMRVLNLTPESLYLILNHFGTAKAKT